MKLIRQCYSVTFCLMWRRLKRNWSCCIKYRLSKPWLHSVLQNCSIKFHIARKLADAGRRSLLAPFFCSKIKLPLRFLDSHGKTYEIKKLQNYFFIYIDQVLTQMQMVTAELWNREGERCFHCEKQTTVLRELTWRFQRHNNFSRRKCWQHFVSITSANKIYGHELIKN
jgi:hypothetical protein